jgi:membrane protease YdiL (CAAX protease family)
MGMPGTPHWVVIALFVLLQGTTGMVAGVGAAAREEIGWRGFLVPELAKVLPFTGVALLSGFIWASWHYPITAVVYRDAGLPPSFWLPTFTFVAVAISFAQAWLRLRTDSVWPPIFLHASHNLLICERCAGLNRRLVKTGSRVGLSTGLARGRSAHRSLESVR